MLLVAITGLLCGSIELYVSPTGNDTAIGSRDAPLQHLFAARDRVRLLRRGALAPRAARIWLMGGTFTVTNTLVLTAADSNVSWHGLNSGSDRPIISGGKPLIWENDGLPTKTGCRMLRARNVAPNVGNESARMVYPQLYINGQRVAISRQPPQGLLDPQAFFTWEPASPASKDSFHVNRNSLSPGDWAQNGTLGDVTALLFTAPWTGEPHRIGRQLLARERVLQHVGRLVVRGADRDGARPQLGLVAEAAVPHSDPGAVVVLGRSARSLRRLERRERRACHRSRDVLVTV